MYCSLNSYRLTQTKFCHAYFNAHKPRKPVAPTICMLEKTLTVMYQSRLYLPIDQKKFSTPILTPITL